MCPSRFPPTQPPPPHRARGAQLSPAPLRPRPRRSPHLRCRPSSRSGCPRSHGESPHTRPWGPAAPARRPPPLPLVRPSSAVVAAAAAAAAAAAPPAGQARWLRSRRRRPPPRCARPGPASRAHAPAPPARGAWRRGGLCQANQTRHHGEGARAAEGTLLQQQQHSSRVSHLPFLSSSRARKCPPPAALPLPCAETAEWVGWRARPSPPAPRPAPPDRLGSVCTHHHPFRAGASELPLPSHSDPLARTRSFHIKMNGSGKESRGKSVRERAARSASPPSGEPTRRVLGYPSQIYTIAFHTHTLCQRWEGTAGRKLPRSGRLRKHPPSCASFLPHHSQG